jgi:hypothetical protein
MKKCVRGFADHYYDYKYVHGGYEHKFNNGKMR